MSSSLGRFLRSSPTTEKHNNLILRGICDVFSVLRNAVGRGKIKKIKKSPSFSMKQLFFTTIFGKSFELIFELIFSSMGDEEKMKQ